MIPSSERHDTGIYTIIVKNLVGQETSSVEMRFTGRFCNIFILNRWIYRIKIFEKKNHIICFDTKQLNCVYFKDKKCIYIHWVPQRERKMLTWGYTPTRWELLGVSKHDPVLVHILCFPQSTHWQRTCWASTWQHHYRNEAELSRNSRWLRTWTFWGIELMNQITSDIVWQTLDSEAVGAIIKKRHDNVAKCTQGKTWLICCLTLNKLSFIEIRDGSNDTQYHSNIGYNFRPLKKKQLEPKCST